MIATPRLRSLRVENFRSINKAVEVRLDAPVVLIHGHNGAGKTSLLSAIELALTGGIASLERADRQYRSQLLHRGTESGHIRLETTDVPGLASEIDVMIGRRDATPERGLDKPLAGFFTERCYLAQSLLGQLLTIYQESNAGAGSRLSQFVHELLGLDHLDALENGLYLALDKRNARKLTPLYERAEQIEARLAGTTAEQQQAIATLETTLQEHAAHLAETLAALGLSSQGSVGQALVLARSLSATDDDARLVDLMTQQRQLNALRRDASRLAVAGLADSPQLAARLTEAQAALEDWASRHGAPIKAALEEASKLLDDVTLIEEGAAAVGAALERVRAEEARLAERLEQAQADSERRIALDDELTHSRHRLAELDREIGTISGSAGALAEALARLVPHVHGDDCPVCGRDFAEVGQGSLSAHLATTAARLSDNAERLAALARERAEVEKRRSAQERAVADLDSRTLEPRQLLETQDQRAKLGGLAARLETLMAQAKRLTELTEASLEARRLILTARSYSEEEAVLRRSIADMAQHLGLTVPDAALPLVNALDRLGADIDEAIDLLRTRVDYMAAAFTAAEAIEATQAEIEKARGVLEVEAAKRAKAVAALASAERIRSDIRQMTAAIESTRTAIVRRVFNAQLNRVWRDLFVRLAPGEAFVPAFNVPDRPARGFSPALVTHHRDGGRGGTPGSMLSAGNLNTAALTLFLALHLSVAPKLPWLLLDDPVQSMDEVHIAQFAALLRTLSKEHGRQVIIGVHDRPLFDYLSLELSPAFAGDELITIEISKSVEGQTRYRPTRHDFAPETALRPIAA